MTNKRVVIDTNVLISHALMADSPAGRVVRRLLENHEILYSAATLSELTDVLYRRKFDRYITPEERRIYLRKFIETANLVKITERITDCEGPKDDQFLELAVAGKADLIVSGDPHLLNMHPYRGIAILRPREIEARDSDS